MLIVHRLNADLRLLLRHTRSMAALGQKRKWHPEIAMSAAPSKGDIWLLVSCRKLTFADVLCHLGRVDILVHGFSNDPLHMCAPHFQCLFSFGEEIMTLVDGRNA